MKYGQQTDDLAREAQHWMSLQTLKVNCIMFKCSFPGTSYDYEKMTVFPRKIPACVGCWRVSNLAELWCVLHCEVSGMGDSDCLCTPLYSAGLASLGWEKAAASSYRV